MNRELLTRLPIQFKQMPATEIEWRDGVGNQSGGVKLKNEGPTLGWGNYKLVYSDCADESIDLVKAGYRLNLLVDKRGLMDVTGVPSGSHLGGRRLLEFLRILDRLEPGKWGQSIYCQLVVCDDQGIEVSGGRSATVLVKAPVKPWVGALDPDRFAADKTIMYCFADRRIGYTGDKETYFGQYLRKVPGDNNASRLYFTFKNTLQTDPTYRGFDCICFVGNIYQVEPGPAYMGGEAMAAELDGEAAVELNRSELVKFLKTEEGKTGWYLIYTKGHVGLIRDGVLYECKPSGRGFTRDTYTPGEQSAVRRYDVGALESHEGLRDQKYQLSKLAPPDASSSE